MPTVPPNLSAFSAALKRFQTTAYRARPVERPDPLDTTGSLLHGGRYNPSRLFSVLYASLHPMVACLEVLDHHYEDTLDLTIHELDVSLSRALDLRDSMVIGSLTAQATAAIAPLEPVDATGDDVRLPVAIAALAFAVGADGIVVPSAAWNRYADDRPAIIMGPRVEFLPKEDPGNVIILRDQGTVVLRPGVYYQGPARLS